MTDEIECVECCGNGQTVGKNSGEDIICPQCEGYGWREPTADAGLVVGWVARAASPSPLRYLGANHD